MKKASEYRKHAEECRTLAKRMKQGEQRVQLLEMAEIWDRLADQRETASDSRQRELAEAASRSGRP